MLKFIEGLPQDVLAIAGLGKITHEDYRGTLVQGLSNDGPWSD
jgi:hypothetical protein